MSGIFLTCVCDALAVEPVDSWRPEASVYESGEILCLASLPVNAPFQSKEKLPVILGLFLNFRL